MIYKIFKISNLYTSLFGDYNFKKTKSRLNIF